MRVKQELTGRLKLGLKKYNHPLSFRRRDEIDDNKLIMTITS